MKPLKLATSDARKLILHCQGLPPRRLPGTSLASSLAAIEQLGYIQIDTISVVQRAHHHTLWNRNPRYHPTHLDELLNSKQVFEYWSHAAAYLPMRDFRYSLRRKRLIKDGIWEHWYDRDPEVEAAVLKRIKEEGPLMAKDFDGDWGRQRSSEMDWARKPSKRALENLFMQGDLMVPERVNFHKVYDLTERVLPNEVDTTEPTDEEYARYLIVGFLRANGLGIAEAGEMNYLRKDTKSLVVRVANEMVESGELIPVKVGNQSQTYVALPDSLELLSKPLARKRAKILSPFDNLVIQRKRMIEFFDFDYQIECYVPAAKRKYGYFVLPILWDGRLVARMDSKADRKTSIFHIQNLMIEPSVNQKQLDLFLAAFANELRSFMEFNRCKDFSIHQTIPCEMKAELERLMR